MSTLLRRTASRATSLLPTLPIPSTTAAASQTHLSSAQHHSSSNNRSQAAPKQKRRLPWCCSCCGRSWSLPFLLLVPLLLLPLTRLLWSSSLSVPLLPNDAVGSLSHEPFSPSTSTIVTAYFPIKSKYSVDTYASWMSTMLGLQDAMVIYTTSDMVDVIWKLRSHAWNRTLIIPMTLPQLPIVQKYSESNNLFWQEQYQMDPERKRHQSYQLFWIWLSKTWFVADAIRRNPFSSQVFMWSDIGCFRSVQAKPYLNQRLLQHTEIIPQDAVLFLAHHAPNPPPSLWWTLKLTEPHYFYHSGSQMAGYAPALLALHTAFEETFQGFVSRHLFVGDDQTILQCTCLQHPNLCAYISHDQVKDNHYFGLRYALFHGGDHYRLWYPPTLGLTTTAESASLEARPTITTQTEKLIEFNHTIVTQTDTLIQSNHTIVTAYFSLRSKYPSQQYNQWMTNMLSLQDPMVIFTSADLVSQMQQNRAHAKNRTVIVVMELKDVPLAQTYDTQLWEQQLAKDPERKIHKSYPLFWIWLSKSWFVTEAIRNDFFQSQVYLWSDIGCFRNSQYRNVTLIQHMNEVPRTSILQMAHHMPKAPPSTVWWNDKQGQSDYFYHSGSQMVGYHDTWKTFHEAFLRVVEGFVERDMFLGEDQAVLQSTCLQHPDLCLYVPRDQVVPKDNHYFGLRYVLHHGGTYQFWRPPARREV